MIFDVHRETLGLRIERRPLRHRPRQQHALVFEPEVVMKMAGEVLLDTKEAATVVRRFDFTFGLGGLLEVPFFLVFLECHSPTNTLG